MIEVPVRVKDALRDGRRLKNYRFNVLNDDGTIDFTIENSNLVSESVKIDERMCTGNQLKFGLCEGSSLEFQYFDYPNITGRQIQAFIDVQYEDANGDLQWHSIPMGFFTVDQCPMQFSTGIRKVTAYNKLKSAYLDEKCNDALIAAATAGDAGRGGVSSIGSMLQEALEGYAVEPEYLVPKQTSGVDTRIAYVNVDHFHARKAFIKDEHGQYIPINGDPNADVYDKVFIYPIEASRPLAYASNDGFNKDPLSQKGYYRSALDRSLIVELYNEAMERCGLSNVYVQVSEDNYVLASEYYARTDVNYSRLYSGVRNVGNVSEYIFAQNDENILKTPYYYITDQYLNEYWFIIDTLYITFVIDSLYDINTGQQKTDAKILEDNVTQIEQEGTWYSNAWTTSQAAGNKVLWFEYRDDTSMEDLTFTQQQAEALPDVTLRELQSAVFETSCQYGQLDRVTDLFKGVELNNTRLLPADTLYPADNLYPLGDSIRANKSMYSKLWTDSQGVQSFRYLIITYKGLDENNKEVEKVLQRTVNADGTTDYNMSDNWLFKNLVWSDNDVGDYADAMVLKMQDISWFPFEMWCAGLPYLETGDELEITNSEGTYTSYVLQRQLNGIQNLQDTFIDGELDIF